MPIRESLKHLGRAVAFLATMLALPATAQTMAPPPEPCAGAPVRAAAIDAYFTAIAKGTPHGAPPAGDIQAYQAAAKVWKERDWANRCQYHADDVRLAARPPSERRVVYMGDSITEIWGLADPDFFTGGRVNRGISGQTSGQMLLRFQADVIALHPKRVHILAGSTTLRAMKGPKASTISATI